MLDKPTREQPQSRLVIIVVDIIKVRCLQRLVHIVE